MEMDIIDKVEEKREIHLDWFYHSIYYDKTKYSSILTEGIKCNELLHNPWGGAHNGIYYISLSKITIPSNECFLSYSIDRPSFVIGEIDPIKCEDNDEYYDYIYTKDPRRLGIDGEYQYYYFIENTYIKGIVYNLYNYLMNREYKFDKKKVKELLELIDLLEELHIEIPIYDYSRRDQLLAHEIQKEKIKYYFKKIL